MSRVSDLRPPEAHIDVPQGSPQPAPVAADPDPNLQRPVLPFKVCWSPPITSGTTDMQASASPERRSAVLPARGRYFLAAVITAGVAVELYSLHRVLTEPFNPLMLIQVGLTLLTGIVS